jgi:lambda family phage portal protein
MTPGRLATKLLSAVGLASVVATATAPRSEGRFIRARYDAAQTTTENYRHWAEADLLSADAAASPEVRQVLRSRARYETANNTYARGVVNARANYIVGTGPRLQLLGGDVSGAEDNRRVERAFTRWAESIDLAAKLRLLVMAEDESGEGFGVLTNNPQLPDDGVQLDLKLIDADQVATPFGRLSRTPLVDGLIHDDAGRLLGYHVLRHHPGETSPSIDGLGTEADELPADQVCHLFKPTRPGQSRGIPGLTPALPLFALLRRYTLAVVQAAESAALNGGVIYSDAPAHDDQAGADPDPMDVVELNRGDWTTLPSGWKLGQVKAEQPTTQYPAFKASLIAEIARCLDIPFNVAAGDSSSYNYASGRLDHQSFFKAVGIDQRRLGRIVLDHLFRAWLREAQLVEGLLPQSFRTPDVLVHLPERQWMFDGYEHVDPVKEAAAEEKRLANHTTTLADEWARRGQDWEDKLRQIARERMLKRELELRAEAAERELRDELGLPDTPSPSPTPDPRSVTQPVTPAGDDIDDEDDQEGDDDA